ncbi:MAG: 3-hydroxyacyl-CoA dehydrogenase NAD-binding domain-containing protein, partial [Candidatus Nitrosocaldus sp.]
MAIERITVLGSGIMGHGIAQISAMAGYKVVMRDIEQQFLDKAMERIRWSLSKLVEKGRLSGDEMNNILDRIRVTVDMEEAVKGADLIIEAIPEDMRLKKETFEKIDSIASSHTIFASNTSTLPITEMASATKREDRFIGIHFFNPPQLMQLVEVIPGARTSKQTIDTAINYVKSLR